MERALECVEESLIAQGNGLAVNRSRERILLPHVSLHYLAGALPESQRMGMKIYSVTRENFRFLVLLFDTETGSVALSDAGRSSGPPSHRSGKRHRHEIPCAPRRIAHGIDRHRQPGPHPTPRRCAESGSLRESKCSAATKNDSQDFAAKCRKNWELTSSPLPARRRSPVSAKS